MAEDGKSFKNEGAILITMFGALLKSREITHLERKTGSQMQSALETVSCHLHQEDEGNGKVLCVAFNVSHWEGGAN